MTPRWFFLVLLLCLAWCGRDGVRVHASGVTAGQTFFQLFPAAGQAAGGTAYSLFPWSTNAAGCAASNVSGPNSIAYNVCFVPLTSTNDAVMVESQATSHWGASIHSVDVFALLWQNDGTTGGGAWQIELILGCAAASSGTFSYVSAVVDSSSPPAQYQYETYIAANLTPTSPCAAGSPIQVWVQRQADSGGSTGLTPRVVSVQLVMRGN